MTKEQEIEAIREFAARLGPNSYYGPVLKESLTDIERAIRLDERPLTFAESVKETEQWVKMAKDQIATDCAHIRANAEADAEKIRLMARRGVQRDLARVLAEINGAKLALETRINAV